MSNDPKITGPGPQMVDGWFVANEDFPADPLERLVYYARLAPSRHNTQPWKFALGADRIDVFADESRWLRIADPARRELHLSVGCAIESLRIAADFAQYGTRVEYFPAGHDQALVARVAIARGGPTRDMPAAGLLQHMVTRRTSRRRFDPAHAVTPVDREALCDGFETGGVRVHLLDGRAELDSLAALELRADTVLLSNPAYRDELCRCVEAGFAAPAWLLSSLGRLAAGHLPLAARLAHADAERLASAPLVALLSTRHDQPADRVQAGEAYMRMALVAESRGIRVQPMSQVLEPPETGSALARLFDVGERLPQHVFRLGYAEPESGERLQRPQEEVVLREPAA